MHPLLYDRCVERTSLRSIIKKFLGKFPTLKKAVLNIYINGEIQNRLNKILEVGDTFVIMPVMSGGAQLLPRTQTVSTFAYDVLANGRRIGNLQTFAPSSTKTLTRVRQIASSYAGETIEIVPSITDHTITISVLELYRQQTLEALGYSNFASIEDLKDSIEIQEIVTKTSGDQIKVVYQECWVQSFNKSGIAANGNIVTDNVTLWVTRVRIG